MILSGKEVKNNLIENIKTTINSLNQKLKLVVIRIGDDKASEIYVNQKRKLCLDVNIDFEEFHLDKNITEEYVVNLIDKLNNDDTVTSILVQLPLPLHLNSSNIINRINPNKDVDGLTDINIGMLYNKKNCIIPCTAKGIETLLDFYNLDLTGKNVCLIGRSNLVGIPLANVILRKNATLTICHSKTNDLKKYTKNADFIFCAVGKPMLITKDMVNENAVIIDIGINKVNDKLCGDADFENLKDYVKAITPVPGGVGVMTVFSVIENIIKCYYLQNK